MNLNIKQEPLVSICCATYNHEKFIRQCLDGFLMQKANFSFEVLINDDASTDKTADIVREYEAKYSQIIKPIYQKENQYSKGVKISPTFQYPRAKGKYMALCEGDDYWTDPYKLQKQVDFLETHPDYVVCSHCYQLYYNTRKEFGEIHPQVKDSLTYNLDMHISGFWATQPLTCMFLKSALDQKYSKYDNAKDFSLFYNILKKGKGYLMKDVMGIYRKHDGGVWSGVSPDGKLFADLACFKGIYDVEKSQKSAELIYSFFRRNPSYFSYDFLVKYFSRLVPYWKIIAKHFGLKQTFILILHELHLRELLSFKHK